MLLVSKVLVLAFWISFIGFIDRSFSIEVVVEHRIKNYVFFQQYIATIMQMISVENNVQMYFFWDVSCNR